MTRCFNMAGQVNRRRQLLALITAIVAEEGRTTERTMRLYCENRISRAAYDNAVQAGKNAYLSQSDKGTKP
jgi:hypothetical protein